MKIPDANHPNWQRLITGEIRPEIDFLATKILLNRLAIDYQNDSSPAATAKGVRELINLFEANIGIQKVQNDLIKIFGKEVA